MKTQLISLCKKRPGLAEVVVHDSWTDKRGITHPTTQTHHVRVERGGAYSFVHAVTNETVVLVPEAAQAGVVQG